jgi:putative oxidoreductase
MEAAGVPGALLPLVVLVEAGGGLLVALGLFTRPAALALAGFTLAASCSTSTSPTGRRRSSS